jgi:hypothetical protein
MTNCEQVPSGSRIHVIQKNEEREERCDISLHLISLWETHHLCRSQVLIITAWVVQCWTIATAASCDHVWTFKLSRIVAALWSSRALLQLENTFAAAAIVVGNSSPVVEFYEWWSRLDWFGVVVVVVTARRTVLGYYPCGS